MSQELAGKVVLITGASRGIGQALARGFAADGAQVVAFARSAEALHTLSQDAPNPILTIAGDVTADADVDRVVAAALHHFGRIDVLVNNAGISHDGELWTRPFEEWAAVIRVNLLGLALCLHRVLPGMLAQGFGRVINVVSRSAEFPLPRKSAYAASKAGVISLTRALAAEVGPPNYPDILINALIPGMTHTAMSDRAGLDPADLQPPEAVYPHTRFLVTLPAGGPHGRVFWKSQEYPIYAQFHEPPRYRSLADLLQVPADPSLGGQRT